MKTTKILTVVLLFISTAFVNKVNAQEQSIEYYFAYAYSYQTDEPVMLITNVKKSKCPTSVFGYGISYDDVKSQWRDYMKAEYKDYYKFMLYGHTSEKESEAQTKRRETMGDWDNKIIKIDDFKVYCD